MNFFYMPLSTLVVCIAVVEELSTGEVLDHESRGKDYNLVPELKQIKS